MRNIKILFTLLTLFALSNVLVVAGEKKVLTIHKNDILKKVIPVDGMTCVGCEVSLENTLKDIKGVVHVKASAKKKSAMVEFDKTKTDINEIKKAIATKGYIPK